MIPRINIESLMIMIEKMQKYHIVETIVNENSGSKILDLLEELTGKQMKK